MKLILNFLRGIGIGIANIIPGVSGGTMAVIFGIYEELTGAIGNFATDKKNRLKYIILLLTIGLGAGAGVVIFAKIFTYLFASEVLKQHTYFFFFGLILGSIPLILKLHPDMKFNIRRFSLIILAFVMVVATALLGSDGGSSANYEVTGELFGILKMTDIDFGYGLWLTLCGFLGGGSMVLPGFSGSALLLSLGEYNNVVYFVDQRMIVPIIFIGIGVVLGIVVCAKVINILLKKYPPATYYFILGLILASNFQIGVEVKDIINFNPIIIIISTVFLIVGAAVSYGLSRIKKPGESAA